MSAVTHELCEGNDLRGNSYCRSFSCASFGVGENETDLVMNVLGVGDDGDDGGCWIVVYDLYVAWHGRLLDLWDCDGFLQVAAIFARYGAGEPANAQQSLLWEWLMHHGRPQWSALSLSQQ